MDLRRRLEALERRVSPPDRSPAAGTLESLPGRPRMTRVGLWNLIRNHPPRETGSPLDVLQGSYFGGWDEAERERPGLPDEDFPPYRLPHASYCASAEDWVRWADALIAARGVEAAGAELTARREAAELARLARLPASERPGWVHPSYRNTSNWPPPDWPPSWSLD